MIKSSIKNRTLRDIRTHTGALGCRLFKASLWNSCRHVFQLFFPRLLSQSANLIQQSPKARFLAGDPVTVLRRIRVTLLNAGVREALL
jgi:hypothetical protein